MNKKNKVFILEMVWTLLMVGLLAFITIRQFELAKMKARDVSRKSDINNMTKILALYFEDYGQYPDDKLNDYWGKEFVDKSGYVYLKSMPKENFGNKQYCYVVSENKKSYMLLADMEYSQDSDYKRDSLSGCGNNNYHYASLSPGSVLKDFE